MPETSVPATSRQPRLDVLTPDDPGQARAVVIVLHGGRSQSREPTGRSQFAALRMRPFSSAIHRATRGHGVAVWTLGYRYRGWNGSSRDPVADVRWALDQVPPEVPVVLVGHSMGARAGLYAAGHPSVSAVCALAPWIERGDPVAQLRDRTLLIAHGDRERMTSPALSYEYAVRARSVTDRVARFEVLGDGHGMLRRSGDWTALVRQFVLGALDLAPMEPRIAAALTAPGTEGLRTPL